MLDKNTVMQWALVIGLLSFGIGVCLWGVSRVVSPNQQGSSDTKSNTETQKDQVTKKHKEIVKTKEPDGTERSVETDDETTTSTTNQQKEVEKHQDAPAARKTINVSALAGVDATKNFIPVYGVHVSKEFIGPITVGAFGLTNGTVGVSVGINF